MNYLDRWIRDWRKPVIFHLVDKRRYYDETVGYTQGEIVRKKEYLVINNLTGEQRHTVGENVLEWFKEVAGTLEAHIVSARFSLIPVNETTRD